MQESIIAVFLAAAFAYLGYTFYKKIRDKNSGCCGCGSECCSKKHGPCASTQRTDKKEITASRTDLR